MNAQRFRFFRDHAAYIVGQRAVCALALARAEELAESPANEGRIEFRWDYDQDHDGGPRSWGWSAADVARWDRSEHECEVLELWVDGEMVDCMGGIWDASREYRRVCEAEMLAQYIGRALLTH